MTVIAVRYQTLLPRVPVMWGPGVPYFNHSTESGRVFSHWFDSMTPPESCAQAATVAVRWASSRFCADAVRQSLLPLNVMHTRQRYGCERKLENAITATTATANKMAIQVAGFIPVRRAMLAMIRQIRPQD